MADLRKRLPDRFVVLAPSALPVVLQEDPILRRAMTEDAQDAPGAPLGDSGGPDEQTAGWLRRRLLGPGRAFPGRCSIRPEHRADEGGGANRRPGCA